MSLEESAAAKVARVNKSANVRRAAELTVVIPKEDAVQAVETKKVEEIPG
jgi:hypothetical protein